MSVLGSFLHMAVFVGKAGVILVVFVCYHLIDLLCKILCIYMQL